MNKKSVTKNYIYNMFFEVLKIILPLVTTPYLSRVLGAEKIGVYSYTLSITTYFILFGTLGIAVYGQREVAYLQDNEKERTKVFYEILVLRFLTIVISLIAFFFVFCLKGEYSTYYRILALELIAYIIDISFFFQGLEEFKKTVIRNSLVKIISVICIFIFVKTREDLIKYFWIYVLSTILGNVSLWMYLPKYICKINLKELNVIKHLKPTIGLFVPQIASQIYTVLDKTMIGNIVVDKSEVGFYEQAQKIVKLLLTIATSFGTVMVPRMANTFANGDNKKVHEYMKKAFSFELFIIFPIMFGIISVAKEFVPIFFGPGYEKVVILIICISPILLAIGLSNVIGIQYLLPTKQQNKYTISVIGGAITNLVFNYFLITYFKSIGASIATVIAECTVTGIQFFLIKDEFKILDVLKLSRNYLISSIIMFCTSVSIGKIISNGLISLIVQICLSIIVYIGLLIIVRDQLMMEGINKIKYKIRSK